MPQQREVVEVQFRLPDDGRLENHPVIVLSNSAINNIERGFIGVMMTSEDAGDAYSFAVDSNMFEKPLNRNCFVRLHLISMFIDDDIFRNSHSGNRMKEEDFKRLLTHINRITFGLSNFRINS